MGMRYLTLATTAVVAFGCTGSTSLDTRTFEVQHLDEAGLGALIDPYVYGDRPDAPGYWSASANLVTVRETPDNLEKIARVLEEFDQPRPGVRLHFQIIEANGAGEPDPEIREIEQQLRQLFRFEGYRLVAQAVMGATERSRVTQEFGPPEEPYYIGVNIVSVRGSGDSGTVRLEVEFTALAGGSLETTVNARAGQTVVLGNAQLRRGGGTLILAVKPELVEM